MQRLVSIGKGGDGRSSSSSLLSEASAQSAGSWSLGPNTNIIAIHACLLPDGKIFYFAGSGFHASYSHGPYEARVLENVDTGADTNVTMVEDLWCNGHTHLANGNLLLAGGTLLYDVDPVNCNGQWHGLDAVYEFDVATRTLIERPSMNHGRWYPTCVTLPDGKVLTYSGLDEYGANNRLTEVYDPTFLSWNIKYDPGTSLVYCAGQATGCPGSGSPCYGSTGNGVAPSSPGYSRMHLMPSGLVISTGFQAAVRTWNPSTGEWKPAANSSTYRHYGCSVLLPLNNTATERGKVLLVGGSPTSSSNSTAVVEVVDFNAGTNLTPVVRTVPNIQYARKFAEAVILPTGKVMLIGGSELNSNTNIRLVPEMFDPVTETWTSLPAMTVKRTYHTVAVLLPDGRIWVAGSMSGRNNWELRTEIFRPSYYFEARPTISGNPTVGGYGNRITIPTPNGNGISKVSLLRLEAKTHHYDPNQRFLWLQILNKTSNSLEVSAPLNAKLAPPGYYIIHVLNASGVPSMAKIIKIPGIGSGTGDGVAPVIVAPDDVTEPSTGAFTDFRQGLEIFEVSASGNESGNVPANVLDNNLATRWSNQGIGSWITADLGSSKVVSDVEIAWYQGDQRTNNFVISVSNDGSVFKTAASGTSSGSTLSKERYSLTSHAVARYVKITVNGNSQTDLASITELGLRGYANLGIPLVTDNLDSSPWITNNYPPNGFPGGTTVLTWKATDASGNFSADTQNVTISDADTPSQVTGLDAAANGGSQIDLGWNPNPEGDINHYNVYRGTTAGFLVDGSTTPLAQPASNSYSDSGLSPNTTYFYKVAAVDDAGNTGPLSAEASTTTGALQVFYDVPSPGNSVAGLMAGGTTSTRYGVEAAASSILIGKSLKMWIVYLRKSGLPSGNINARVRRSSDDAIVAIFSPTISASTLSTTLSPVTFTLASPYTIQTGDKIVVEYSGPSRVEIDLWLSDKFNGMNTRRTRYSGTSYSSANHDVSGSMSTG